MIWQGKGGQLGLRHWLLKVPRAVLRLARLWGGLQQISDSAVKAKRIRRIRSRVSVTPGLLPPWIRQSGASPAHQREETPPPFAMERVSALHMWWMAQSSAPARGRCEREEDGIWGLPLLG
ncbi:hypothetical protein JZ751_014302 [Albula glossodonta]|uniref:Uncharacterized protein n=1 Tax=Albula glossodonta TaxID=121402 RepID=A0A8T2NW50_9TELE|nr:hypothetical protein JZ751_014302 [Albula glossodonta]